MKSAGRVIPLLVLALALAPAAMATNGYFVHGQGTASKAMAGAATALPQEALDADTNPAAAAFVPRGYSVSVGLFSPVRQYTVNGSPSGVPQTFGLQPGTVESESNYFPMPSLGMNFRPAPFNAIAVNLSGHGGMNTDYRTNTFYGANRTGVDLMQAFVTATYAHKLGENHALGISAVGAVQRFKATGLEAFAAFSSDPENLTGNGYDTSQGVGFRVGYLGRVLPQLSIGAAYQSEISMTEFDSYAGLFAEGGGFNIPSTANVGLAYSPVESFTLTTDYQQIHYSDVGSVGNALLPALMTAQLGSDNGAGFGWRDINVYKLGAQWKSSDTWTWRAGYSISDQPIPDSEVLFNILAPGVIEEHWTAGFSKMLSRAPARFNMAVMYAPSKTVRGANPLEIPGRQEIELEMYEWEVEFGYSFGF